MTISKSIQKSVQGSKQFTLVEGGKKVLAIVGTLKNGENKYKMLPVKHVGPTGVLCEDDNETYITWDKF
jgi:hypothetical protein